MIDYEFAKEWLRYNDETGDLFWIKSPNGRVKIGSIAGFEINKPNYRCVCFRGRYYLSHRIAWLLKTGILPDSKIDHKDRNGLNNKWSNLRLASDQQNQANRQRGINNTSGYKGVFWHKSSRKWCSAIMVNGKNKWLGTFISPEDAQVAYLAAAKMYFGEYANAG
jgi:HNH endonuclease/AP2 domain